MRRRRWILGIILVLIFLFVVVLIPLAHEERLGIAVAPLSYQRLRNGNLQVRFVLTNISQVAIQYRQFYDGQFRIEKDGVWKQSRMSLPVFAEVATILEPKAVATNQVILPSEVERWQVGYTVRAAGARTRLLLVLPLKVAVGYAKLIRRWVSNQEGAPEEVWGDVVDARSWIATHPEPIKTHDASEIPRTPQPRFWEKIGMGGAGHSSLDQ